jgi:hypothetical protein
MKSSSFLPAACPGFILRQSRDGKRYQSNFCKKCRSSGLAREIASEGNDTLEQPGYVVTEQSHTVRNHPVHNLEAKPFGSQKNGETVVMGARYGCVQGFTGGKR